METTALVEQASKLTPEEVASLMVAFKDQTEDLRTIKNTINTLLLKIGFLNEDGTFRENVNMKMIMDLAMKATMQSGKFKEDMSFLSEMLPLVQKYKHL